MSGFSPTAAERRIVLLGKDRAEKNRVVRTILGDVRLKEESQKCVLYEGEQEGRRISIVDTPGWDSVSIEFTTEKIKNEIERSVTLCPPGPHALILVLPVNGNALSFKELESAHQHIELLSKRVWDHTLVLFLCDDDVKESTIKENIQDVERLLKKCKGRHYVMRQSESETLARGLFSEIDSMVHKNPDEFFLPQIYYELMQSKMPPKKDTQSEEKVGEELVLRRRGSLQGIRPTLTKETEASDSQREKTEAQKSTNLYKAMPQQYITPAVLILMALLGALLGSIAGSVYGTVGSGLGSAIGFVVFMLIGLLLVRLIT